MLDKLYQAFIYKDRYWLYLEGLSNTIKMAAFATILGILIGLIVASVKVSKDANIFTKILASIFNVYTTIIRGTPVVLQLFIITGAIFTARDSNMLLAGGICFGINSGAYVSEIFRGAILSIDKGQMEAGRSLGLSHFQTMKSIIIPQAIKNAIPALGNEFIMLIKETSIAFAISVTELMNSARFIGSRTYKPLYPYFIAAVFYLSLVLLIQKIQSTIERRLHRDA